MENVKEQKKIVKDAQTAVRERKSLIKRLMAMDIDDELDDQRIEIQQKYLELDIKLLNIECMRLADIKSDIRRDAADQVNTGLLVAAGADEMCTVS